MHQCLLIQEILISIFRHVIGPLNVELALDDFVGLWDRKSLAALARTCCAFRDPALDLLWARLHTFNPLIQCLPGVWELHSPPNSGPIIKLRRPILAADWRIFHKYARRVRALGGGYVNKGSSRIDTSVMHALCSYPSLSTPILPNLRYLYWDDSRKELFPFLRFFLTPSLVRLELSLDSWTDSKLTTLSSLGALCPALKEYYCPNPRAIAMPAISESILQWEKLEVLETGIPSSEALRHLSLSAYLKHLIVHLPPDLSAAVPRASFGASLPSVTLLASTLSHCTRFVEQIKLSPQTVRIVLYHPSSEHLAQAFLTSLASRLSADTTQRITIEHYNCDISEIDKPENVWGWATMIPFTSFGNLRTLNIKSFCSSGLDDDDLDRLASSWPLLETFILGTEHNWYTPAKLTHRGLLALLSRCPRLRSLGLVFDATTIGPPSLDKPGCGAMNVNITTLDVGNSAVGEALFVAAFLSAILPNVKTILRLDSFHEDMLPRERTWGEVQSLLLLFVA
ncbi:hypothetical protein BV22DRAFT_19209 [Leucogyrophana mollusca]|uniref:Uncharacterized protein n=1 Tax=Leucogyrophana mollusca TaxID=85980 RepID=A0ACB8BZ30_9AGAM|nr:hypothetical protein BV22DRAFT_19209 [Leucogyrophana mollusca]